MNPQLESPPNIHGLDAFPSRVAAYMPAVRGQCPACGMKSLFLAVGNHITCASLECPSHHRF